MNDGQERVYQAAVDAFILDRDKWQAEAERLRAEVELLRKENEMLKDQIYRRAMADINNGRA
jgi:hypothetical protein